jgi:hypothetical protein
MKTEQEIRDKANEYAIEQATKNSQLDPTKNNIRKASFIAGANSMKEHYEKEHLAIQCEVKALRMLVEEREGDNWISFETSKGKFLAVKAGNDYNEIGDIETNIDGEKFLSYFTENEREDIWIDLPQCNYQILSPLSEMNEELWKDVVDLHSITRLQQFGYMNYIESKPDFNDYTCKTATESGESLMQYLGIEITEPYILLKEI